MGQGGRRGAGGRWAAVERHLNVLVAPTASFAARLDGVTEVRAGVYVFMDLVMAGLGVCTLDDVALSVLVTVIGHQRAKDWLITDGGWMALSRDRGTSDRLGQLNPLQRGGSPEEIAHAALFLASEESSYVNGHALVVDGGLASSHPVTKLVYGRTAF